MFFIAFFGIHDKKKHIGTYNNAVCLSCGKWSRYEIYKSYRYFHIFLIPIFRWNVRYLVKASCCGCLYELEPTIGKEFEKNICTEIKNEYLRPINQYSPFKYCSKCSRSVPVEYNYCPYCGENLSF